MSEFFCVHFLVVFVTLVLVVFVALACHFVAAHRILIHER